MKTILEEAIEVTEGPRRQSYGHPREHLKSLAEHWTAYLKRRGLLKEDAVLEPKDTSLMMVLLKVDREANAHSRDNLVDICGWTRTVEMLEDKVVMPGEYIYVKKAQSLIDAVREHDKKD